MADGETVIATVTAQNIIYGFRCVSVATSHVWLLEGTCLYSQIQALAQRVSTLEQSAQSLTQHVTALETQPENQPVEGEGE